ncbi:hypothetical protein [Mucilaginibacter sp. PAMB04168]|uniref:hypothetical protein n=1 Tax=Mucilaginibacter sp. PAMB04168 TaxID=3138567 RepID=UPI0031F6F549
MNNIFLPELLSVNIKNFSLYPNGLNFNHEFVKGVNLIVGGNGMGKTTLVNIIKHSIIGNYDEGFDLTRTYKGRKIEKRTNYPWNYFSKRKDTKIQLNSKASVTSVFKINTTQFQVERDLEDIALLSVFIDGVELKGEFLNQFTYDNLCYEFSRMAEGVMKEEVRIRISNTLQNKFEKRIEKVSNIPFDDLIFFINKILFFGEDHKTILWNSETYDDVQTELFNKYFNPRELNNYRQEANRQAKYFDTQARHRSEDIRVIKSVLEKATRNEVSKPVDDVNEQISTLKSAIDTINYKIESIQGQRNECDNELRIISNQVNKLSQEATDYEREQKKIEKELIQSNWIKLNPNYNLFLQSIQSNEICPMCSQELSQSFIDSRVAHSHNCILCNQDIVINKTEVLTNEQVDSKNKLKTVYSTINELQRQIYGLESKLLDLDREFKTLSIEKRKFASQLRVVEFEDIKDKEKKPESNLQAFYDEIEQLELLKDDFQEKSRVQKEIASEISVRIEEHIVKNARTFSSLFSGYAEKFLGVQCSLTFEELNGQKRFYPVIDGKIREEQEELSESQRFFVDHAFRMSILSFFYNKPSIYIIETPDSSLDISYERNAADVFKKFISNYPYCLILTTNLNNSEFLNYLVSTHDSISVIDLFKIAKKSPIQGDNDALNIIYKKLIASIDEK